MAKMWEASGEARDSLLAANVNISEQKEVYFKITNLEKARGLGKIT